MAESPAGDAGAPSERLRPGDALLIVDVQPDFCPGGALPVPAGEAVIPLLNRWIEAARRADLPVYASRDWHPPRHPSFESEGGPWPPHCVQETLGSVYHPDLRLPGDAFRISKGTRLDRDQLSVFDESGLAEHLRARGVERLWVGGLAQELCVRASVLDALREGFAVHVFTDATRPVEPQAGAKALLEMEASGAVLEET